MDAAGKPRHIPIREDWLALRTEAAIEPERPIVDAHHHLWDKPGNRYLLDELTRDLAGGHNVVATVFVEGKGNYRPDGPPELRPLGETGMAAGIAAESLRRAPDGPHVAAAIVGFVDLRLGEATGPLLDRHAEAARGRLRGVRNPSAWHADPEARGSVLVQPPGLLYDPAFRAGLHELEKRRLVFDAWMYHTQLGDLVDLAHDFPRLPIVLDHLGGPIGIGPYAGRRGEVLDDWRHFLRRLSRHDNVRVKLGGFGMLMAGFDFHDRSRPPASEELARAWGPCMTTCIELFSPERCMFESNFPVDKGTVAYPVLWNAFKRIAAAFPAEARDALFFRTAARTYGLTLPEGPGKVPLHAAESEG